MSTAIEQRIVEMQFDNKQFENNIQTSLSSIDKLKQGLNLSGASRGLENVGAAVKNFNMSGLSSAADTVQAKFSALGVMGVTALANITNSALNAGKKIISALTIDPIRTGLSEYETKINAIQTIMSNTASKGTTMEDVTQVIGDLNTYADKTIYNFAEMTRNIGTFTAAGVGLEDSAKAIQGIANLAASSGSNSQQASSAMYQLSQALASGVVKLMDWNSVVNAGMGGEKFQEALKQTARDHGVAVDDIIDANGSFRDSLQEGWLSADILNETLNKFTVDGATNYAKSMMESGEWTQKQADALVAEAQAMEDAATKVKTFTQLWDTLKEAAQSGWSQSWEIIVGDFEEAKELFTGISDVIGGMIGASADARNGILQGWKDLGGRTAIMDSIKNIFEGIMNVVIPIKQAFSEIFPPITAKQLVAFSEGLRQLTSHLKLSDKTSANLKSTFKGLFAIIDILGQALSAVFNALSPIFGELSTLGENILEVTASWGEWLVNLNETIKTTDVFNVTMQKIVEFVKSVIDAVKTAAIAIKDFIQSVAAKINFPGLEIFHSFIGRIHERMSQVGEAAGGMKSGVVTAIDAMGSALANSKFLQALQLLWDGVKSISSSIINALCDLIGGAVDTIGSADFSGIFDLVNTAAIGGITVIISKFLKNLTEPIQGIQGILGGVTGVLDGVRGCFEAYQTQLKADALLKIASAIAILTASIVVISLIDSNKLAASLGAITILFADLMGAMAIFSKLSGELTGVAKTCASMIGISIAILILASALKKISNLSVEEMTVGLVGIVSLTATMVGAAKIMSSGSGAIAKGATQMVIFAAAIKILASVCEDLSKLSWENLSKGLVGVGILMAEISIFMKTAKFSGKMITTATGIVILASALKILASVCKDFGEMHWEDVCKGLSAIGVLLAEIALFTNLTGNAKHVISTGIALIAIGAAMKIFASAIKDFSSMKWEQLAQGLAGMAGALLAVTVAVKFMPKNMIGMGIGLITISTALVILAEAVGKMSGMTWEEIARGLTVLGGSIAILAIGLRIMNGTLAGSAAMVVATAALAMLTPVLSVLGAMSWTSIVKGLVAIAGAFAIIGIAGLVLTPLVPTILALGGSFALIGIGVLGIGAGLLAAGAGLSAIAIGFTALATAGIAGATAIVGALTVIITGVISLIPAVIEKIGEGVITLCKVIANGAPEIGKAVKAIVLNLVDVLVECIPAIAEGALELVAGVLASLVEYTPDIVDSLFQFLIGVLDGITKNLPNLIKSVVDVFMAFFQGVIDALVSIDPAILLKGIIGIGLISAMIAALAAVATLIPGAMLGVLGMGAIIAELALVLVALGGLAQIPGLLWLVDEGGKLLEGIGTAIGSFVGGIVGGFMSGVSSGFPKIGSDLSAFMTNAQPFIDGANNINASTMSGVKALAETILILTATNVLKGLTSWFTGGSSMVKFSNELIPFGKAMKEFSLVVDGISGDTVTNAATAGKALAEMAATLPNSGGVLGFFSGENDMSTFGNQLIPFGKAMKGFSVAVNGLGVESITNAATAGKAIAEMATTLPNSGGVLGFFSGENDMLTFGKQLVPFGKAMKDFSVAVNGLGVESITNAATAGEALVELASTLPHTGGAVSWFTGNNDIDTFGTKLVSFGKAMKEFSLVVDGMKVDTVTNAATAGQALAELADTLPDSGGIGSWFTGDNDIADFGAKLVSFGQSFAAYYESISTINTTQLSSVIQEFSKLVELANGTSDVDTSGMSTFSQNLALLGDSGVDSFITAFTNSTDRVSTVATTMMTVFVDSTNATKPTVVATFNSIAESIITTLNGYRLIFTIVGNALMFHFIIGIKSQGETIKSAFINIIGECLTAIQNKYNDFFNAARYLVEGFAEGISVNTYLAETKSRAMAAAAVRAAKDELDEHSPSKVGYAIGDFFGVAFVNAISDYAIKAYKAGSNMANSAKKGLSNTASKIKDIVSTDINMQPTIRPVLDLSSMRSGVSTVKNMLKMGSSVGLLTNVGSINSMMNIRNQNRSTNEIVSAIDNLRKDLGDIGNTSYNINGVTYDDGSNISDAIKSLVRAAIIERRV